MRLPKLDRILANDSQLQPVLAKARDIRTLAGLVDGFLSPDLACQVRVANFKEGELVLIAAHSAAAAKLRLLAPSLSRFLAHQRWQVSSVRVGVQPNTSHIVAKQKTAQFSTHTLDCLNKLYDEMKPSAARQSLGVMLVRQGVRIPARAPLRRTATAPTSSRKRRT